MSCIVSYSYYWVIDILLIYLYFCRWVEVPKPKSYDEEPESLEEMDEMPFNDELQSDSMNDKIQPTKESEGVFLSNLW